VLQAMAEVLELLGYRVLKAPNGLEALAIYRRMGTEIDLILTDAIMPDIHGVELVGRIRALHPDAKAVLVTGYTLNDDLRQARESGILDILSKPLDMETLGRAVRRALDSH
jgi:CheY-like chemotaxis protein